MNRQARPRTFLLGTLLVASSSFAGCALNTGTPGEANLAASLTAGERDAALPPPTDLGAAAPDCQTDTDCGELALCIAHVCQVACENSSMCQPGSSCNFDNGGYCWNHPGCNPPPPGTMCSEICWGFCDARDGG